MQILKQRIQHATLRAELCVQRTESYVQSNDNDFVLFSNQSIRARVLPGTFQALKLQSGVWRRSQTTHAIVPFCN